ETSDLTDIDSKGRQNLHHPPVLNGAIRIFGNATPTSPKAICFFACLHFFFILLARFFITLFLLLFCQKILMFLLLLLAFFFTCEFFHITSMHHLESQAQRPHTVRGTPTSRPSLPKSISCSVRVFAGKG